jgi:hypothetical protein
VRRGRRSEGVLEGLLGDGVRGVRGCVWRGPELTVDVLWRGPEVAVDHLIFGIGKNPMISLDHPPL